MPYYKDSSNALHYLDDVSFSYLLTPDCVEISDSDAQAIQDAQVPVEPTATPIDPVTKLKDFLALNPDVAALLK